MSANNPKGRASPSNGTEPFVSTDNFQYFSWTYRWFYQHLLPDTDNEEEAKVLPIRPTKQETQPDSYTRSTSVNGQSSDVLNLATVHDRKLQTLRDILVDITKSKKSSLTCGEHIQYVRFCLKYFRKGHVQKMMGKEASFYQILHKRVCEEQGKFLDKARAVVAEHCQLYEYLHPDADRYIKELLKNHFLRVYKYPRYYELKDAIPLLGTTPSVSFRHIATLLDIGSIPRLLLPKLKAKLKTPQNYEKVSNQYTIGDDLHTREKALHKTPVSKDPNAEVLAKKHGASVVISSSSLKRLADNFAPEFGDSWTIPIVVCHYATDTGGNDVIVYVDKPLPQSEMNAQERNRWFHKYSLKTLILHPQFKKPPNREPITVYENIDYLKCDSDLADLEDFGVENSPQNNVRTFSKPSNVPLKVEICKSVKQPDPENTVIQNLPDGVQTSCDDIIKSESLFSDCDSTAENLETQQVKNNMSIRNSDDSEAENLVIDECAVFSPHKKTINNRDAKPCKTVLSRTCDINDCSSPKSTCSSDALCIDESYKSPELHISPLSSPQPSSECVVVSSEESVVLPNATRGKRKLRSSATKVAKRKTVSENKDVASVTDPKQIAGVTAKSALQNNDSSCTSDADEISVQSTKLQGMITRSKSKGVSGIKTSDYQICTRTRGRKAVNDLPKEHSDSQTVLAMSLTPSNMPLKSVKREKNLLLEVFGSSSSEDEMLPCESQVITSETKDNSPKPLIPNSSRKLKIKPVVSKKHQETSGEEDTNPLSRILADQEKMFQSASCIHPSNIVGLGSANKGSSSTIKYGRENPKDYTPCAGDKHVVYNLFSVGSIRLLVRCSVHGKTESNAKRRIQGRQYTIFPKLEYQSYCGGEVLTPSEEVRQAVATLIRPRSVVLQVRIDAYTSEIMAVETHEFENYLGTPQYAVDLIHTLLQKLPFLPAGSYVMTHKKSEGFVNILKQTDGCKQSSYDLHGAYSYILAAQPPPITVAPWVSIDPRVFFKRHQQHIPATFQPCARRPPGFQKKTKKKKIQKQTWGKNLRSATTSRRGQN